MAPWWSLFLVTTFNICTYIGLDSLIPYETLQIILILAIVQMGQDRTARRLSYPERLIPAQHSDNHVPMNYFLINKEFHDKFSG